MKKLLTLTSILGFLLVFSGCDDSTSDVPSEDTDGEMTDEVEEVEEEIETVSATFASEYDDFTYTFEYDPLALTLSEEALEGASENGPSFSVDGGGHITGATGQIDSPGYEMHRLVNALYYEGSAEWPTSTPDPSIMGDNEVYRFSWTQDSACVIEYGVVVGMNEALTLRLEVCNVDDHDVALDAFTDLFEGLTIVQN